MVIHISIYIQIVKQLYNPIQKKQIIDYIILKIKDLQIRVNTD